MNKSIAENLQECIETQGGAVGLRAEFAREILAELKRMGLERDEIKSKLAQTEKHLAQWRNDYENLVKSASESNVKFRDENIELKSKLADLEAQAANIITEACCNAVERLNEWVPTHGWDSGERVAEMYISRLNIQPKPSQPIDFKAEINNSAEWTKLEKWKAGTNRNLFEAGSFLRSMSDKIYYSRGNFDDDLLVENLNEIAALLVGFEELSQPIANNSDKFCDNNCTWRDHHVDCERHEAAQVSEPVQRITEQDAREILRAGSIASPDTPLQIDLFLKSKEGLTLLAKLNEHREQETVQIVSDEIGVQLYEEMQDAINNYCLDGALPLSVIGSWEIIFKHWVDTKDQVTPNKAEVPSYIKIGEWNSEFLPASAVQFDREILRGSFPHGSPIFVAPPPPLKGE